MTWRWKNAGAGQYTVWSHRQQRQLSLEYHLPLWRPAAPRCTWIESVFSTRISTATGRSALPNLSPPTVIQTNGTTSLVQIGGRFFFTIPPAEPVLRTDLCRRCLFTAGAYGSWTRDWRDPGHGWLRRGVGRFAGAGQYTVWSIDSNGNYLSSIIAPVAGSSTALQSIESVFHQDLNGDGTIGSPSVSPTVIQTNGATSLVQIGIDYFLYNTTSGTGPELTYAGVPFTVGAYGGWTAIGAIQVTGGYDVALKVAGASQYTVWSTDSNGNYLSALLPRHQGAAPRCSRSRVCSTRISMATARSDFTVPQAYFNPLLCRQVPNSYWPTLTH